MTKVQNVINGIITFISGIFFMVIGWYIIPSLVTAFDTVFQDAIVKTIFYTGLIILMILWVIVAPIVMIMGKPETEE